MQSISIADIGYLLFVLPGFVLIWSYRYFSRTEKKMGEFEYAAWSYIWGVPLTALVDLLVKFSHVQLPDTPITNEFQLLGALMGMGIAVAVFLALPMGFVVAWFGKLGLYRLINKVLFGLLNWLGK